MGKKSVWAVAARRVFAGFVYLNFDAQVSEVFYGVGSCKGARPYLVPAPDAGAGQEATEEKKPYIIVVDPGHGGTDTGAESIAIETDVVNMTAGFLYELLERDEAFTPLMTRTEDEDPDSGQRADIANRAGRDLFLALHANSDSSRSTSGFECYPVPPGRDRHERSMKFAKCIVNQIVAAGGKLRGGTGEAGIKYAYYSGSSKKIVDSGDNKVRSMPSFGVLEKTNCPAVLVEQCFVTNYSDVENWTGPDGCKKAALAYYKAIRDYYGLEN